MCLWRRGCGVFPRVPFLARAISGLDVRGFVQDAAHFNATWLRLPFDNDGEPVFSHTARGAAYFYNTITGESSWAQPMVTGSL